ncbi:MAG: WYL domain-containing protein [Anaerolineales bacterium]
MRADRLLKMMLLLQNRGKYTAQELARELEVSVRTVYRDVMALSISGVPIYTDRGPGGGIQLIEDYRTSLTGLSEQEVQALFMLSVPAAMNSLGIGEEMQGALLKLSASLPTRLQAAHSGVRQRIIIDSDKQIGQDRTPSFLSSLYQAVWEDKCVEIEVAYSFGYRAKHFVEALGLVSSGEHWFLVCRVAENEKVFSLGDIVSVNVLESRFDRIADFDLTKFWRSWLASQDFGYLCSVKIKETVLESIKKHSAIKVVSESEEEAEGYRQCVLKFDYESHALRTFLGYGNAVVVLEPLALRMTIKDYAKQILKIYEHS